MNKLFITHEDLKTFVEALKKTCDEFIGPSRQHLNDIAFGDVKNDGEILLNYDGNTILSPRTFLLPQTETLFEIKGSIGGKVSSIEDKKSRIFYGVRPCDTLALSLMRRFFLEGIVDRPYQDKMENATFITLACAKPCSERSFCREIGSGPVAKKGFDIQLVAINRGYLVESGSKKGGAILRKYKKLFIVSTPSDIKESKRILKDFAKEAKPINYKRLAGIMRDDLVKESVWDDIGLRCVICSGCITVCPTCSCFSVTDRMNGTSGVRVRYCDGCPYAGFTRMAGGAMPKPDHKDHIRRFFEHKLNVDVERYGVPSCVGCGRCIETCPGNISIRKFIDDAMASVKK